MTQYGQEKPSPGPNAHNQRASRWIPPGTHDRRSDTWRVPNAFCQKEYIKNHVPGYTDDNIVLIENGDVLEIDEFAAKVVDKHEMHKTFIDEESLGEIEYDVIRERKKLAYGGAISLVVTVEKGTHELIGQPQVRFKVSHISIRLMALPNKPDKL